MIEFEIDGRLVSAEEGEMIIETADREGIYIPRFCYHNKLPIAANCRMCLVEVEKSGKALPACATPVTAGMKVFTTSPKTLEAQRAVMEFLLINHPLDCPICDQGGECELQDLAMGFGAGEGRYDQTKRSVADKDLGPLISSHMTRCIQCTRCVRFGEEVAGLREMGATGRGEDMEIGTYVQKMMRSEVSGNIIDLCPVGALTSKPFEFVARAWELTQRPSLAPHDALGSNLFVHTRYDDCTQREVVMRVVPRANEAINEVWLSDRDRFSYEGVNHEDRLTHPMVKRNHVWHTVSWEQALQEVVSRTRSVLEKQGAEELAGLAAPHSTLEELYLFQDLLRKLGSENIDHRYRQVDFRGEMGFPGLPISVQELEKQTTFLLVGLDLHREQPLLGLRVRKAAIAGAKVSAINAGHYDMHFDLTTDWAVQGYQWVEALAQVLKALMENVGKKAVRLTAEEVKWLSTVEISPQAQAVAETLQAGTSSVILLGRMAISHPDYSQLQAFVQAIAEVCGAKVGYLADGANARGAWLAGVRPQKESRDKAEGLDAMSMFRHPRQVYFFFNVEPEYDVLYASQALAALQKASLVVMFTPFRSPTMMQYADVLLPITPFTETAGTYVNVEGTWQSMTPVVHPLGEAKPGWKVCRVLGNLFELPDFEFTTVDQVKNQLESSLSTTTGMSLVNLQLPKRVEKLYIQWEWPTVCVDHIVRRASALQATLSDEASMARLHPHTAHTLGLEEGGLIELHQENAKLTLSVTLDKKVPENQVVISLGILKTRGFGYDETSQVVVKGRGDV